MMRRTFSGAGIGHLVPYSIAATLGVVVLPIVVVLALVSRGLPEPQMVLSAALGLILSCGAAAVGTSLWLRRPESVQVSFGELMLWRFLRRKKAERTLEEGARTLDLDRFGDEDREIRLDSNQRLEVLRTLAAALEAKDPYTHGHSRRVERHVYRTAMAMHMPVDQVEELRLSAALHDVGKVGIPERILRKPASLDTGEMELIREHCIIGAAMVSEAAVPRVTEGVRHHHECWNGHGYPDGLAGEEIPLFARIIAVADAYDAITSARPYRAGSSRRDAVEVLRAGSGKQFDPEIVEAFISTLPAALPAAGALLIFFGPAETMRRISAWGKSVGGGSLAAGAGAAGLVAVIGAAGITGNGLPPNRFNGMDPPATLGTTSTPVVLAGDEHRSPAAIPKFVDAEAVTREPKGKRDVQPGPAKKKATSKERGGSSAPTSTANSAKPEGDVGAAKEPSASQGHEPPGDPQPEHGRDCEPKNGEGKGHELHCS